MCSRRSFIVVLLVLTFGVAQGCLFGADPIAASKPDRMIKFLVLERNRCYTIKARLDEDHRYRFDVARGTCKSSSSKQEISDIPTPAVSKEDLHLVSVS